MINIIQKLKLWWVDWLICGLFGLVGLIVFKINYVVGTTFLGWDTVWSEVNIPLAFKRALAGIWQEFQGVGLQGGHGYVSDLLHTLWIWIISLFVPLSQVRYVSIILLWVMGAWGIYFLVKKLISRWGALVAGSIYLFHPFIIQQFFVIHDSFAWFFAFLPWSILAIVSLLDNWKSNGLVWVLLTQIILSFAGFIPPQMVAYGLVIGLLLLAYVVAKGWIGLKRAFIVGIVLFVAHVYWLLPFARYALSNTDTYLNSKLNLVTTPDNGLKSVNYGGWDSLVFGKGFYFESLDIIDGDVMHSAPILSDWENYWNQGSVRNVLAGVFVLAVLGLVSVFVELGWWKWGMMGGFLLSASGLAISAWPISYVGKSFHLILIFEQAFRIGFTKLSILYVMFLAVFVAIGVEHIGRLLKKWGKFLVCVLVVVGMVYVALPIFKGNFIYKRMKVEVPKEYLSLIDFMKDRPKYARIATLPAQTYNGWMITDWGYTGSGFLFYGIEQSSLDRAFDVWSTYNEGFYNQISTALYSCESGQSQISNSPILKLNCEEQFSKVLDKYDVRYVLLDESVIAPGQGREILRIEETKKIAQELGWEQKFKEGFLSVWDTRIEAGQQYVTAPSSYAVVEADTSKVREDVVFDQLGTYVSSNRETPPTFGVPTLPSATSPVEESPVITYPFANLMREEVKGVEYGDNSTRLITNLKFSNSQMEIPGWKIGDIVRIQYKDGLPVPAYFVNGQPGPIFLGKEKPEEGKDIIYAKVSEGKEWSEYLKEQRFKLLDSNLKIEVPTLPRIYDFGTMGQGKLGNCDVLKRGTTQKLQSSEHSPKDQQGSELLATAYVADGRGAACDYIEMTEIDPRMSYLMRFQGNNIEGRSLKYFLYNTGSKRNDIEYLLGKNKYDQTFSLLPWAWDGYYTLNIETRSFGQRAENLVQPIEVRWFPLEQIAGARLVPIRSDLPAFDSAGWDHPSRSDLKIVEVRKTGTWLYRVKAEGSGLLKLSQGYDDGWVSPGLTHVKVDGWANGWIIPQSGEATIFYWPQLLEYLGFVILGAIMIWLMTGKK